MIKPQLKNYLLAQLTVIVMYHGTMLITPFKAVDLPLTYIDLHVPFNHLFTYIYISFFFQLFFVIMDTEEKISSMCAWTIVLCSVIAAFVFFFYPTKMDVSYYMEGANAVDHMSRFIRSLDRNYNCFPSLHVASSLIATYYFNMKRNWIWRFISSLWFFLMTWSVVSTKQHYFVDVLGGIFLAIISIIIITRYTRMGNKKPGLIKLINKKSN
jgi:membrane-associated phospholipid phosphatase